MKVVILAGGRGTRLTDEDGVPKPLVEIGGRPILWHIMRYYACFGLRDFVIATGDRGGQIARWLLEDCVGGARRLDLDYGARSARAELEGEREGWRVSVVDTGQEANKLDRLRQVAPLLGGSAFMLTYADGLADVDLSALIRHHRGTEALITVTAVRPPARFGRLRLDGPKAVAFAEKAGLEEDWINGGYMLCAGELLASLDEEEELEAGLLRRLAAEGRLGAHRHRGFWQCMDTPREAALLNRLWQRGEAPWKRWSEA